MNVKRFAYLATLTIIASLVLAPIAMANPFANMDDETRQTFGLAIGICIILASAVMLHFSNKAFGKNSKNNKNNKNYNKNMRSNKKKRK